MNRADEAVKRGADWLLGLLQPDGSLRDAPALNAYYKTPAALLWSGHAEEAGRVLDYVAARFLKADGDLDGSGVPWYERFRIYPHAWLGCAALKMNRADVAEPLVGFLAQSWNGESGGFRADAEGTEEIMTTSMAGLACLWAGRMDIAAGVAGWLERVFEAQPDLRQGLMHVWKPGVGLVEGDGSVWFRVNASELKQWYFQYGISAAFLAEYSRLSGESRWLELGRRYLHASALCREDVYTRPQSGKIGWGAAWTQRLSGKAEDQALVDAVVDGLCAIQCGDGSWNGEGVYEAEPGPNAEPRMDVTSEFVALLSWMEKPIV